jgi:putative ABC transport system substrate-binding protein
MRLDLRAAVGRADRPLTGGRPGGMLGTQAAPGETAMDHRAGKRPSRRRFVQGVGVAGLGLLAGCGRLPWQAQQPSKVHRIGWLGFDAPPPLREAFQQGLRDLGYVEGQYVLVQLHSGDGQADPLPEHAAELVQLAVDVIVAATGTDAKAAQNATSNIPIVFATSADPVGQELVVSLARPGGNVTGVSTVQQQLAGKRVELLKEVFPGLSQVGVLWATAAANRRLWEDTRAAAQALGLGSQLLELPDPNGFESVAESINRQRVDGLIALSGTRPYLSQIVDLAARDRLPAIYPQREFVEAGGLMTYGPNVAASFRRAAYFVDRILKGTSPADLPVEQPREFDFVINLRTAQALGLTIPPHVLLQATELIQ